MLRNCLSSLRGPENAPTTKVLVQLKTFQFCAWSFCSFLLPGYTEGSSISGFWFEEPKLANSFVLACLMAYAFIRIWLAWETWSSTIHKLKPGLQCHNLFTLLGMSDVVLLVSKWYTANCWIGLFAHHTQRSLRMGCHSNENNLFYTQKAIWQNAFRFTAR